MAETQATLVNLNAVFPAGIPGVCSVIDFPGLLKFSAERPHYLLVVSSADYMRQIHCPSL